jgi:putative acyl-CoA dehydrogenase
VVRPFVLETLLRLGPLVAADAEKVQRGANARLDTFADDLTRRLKDPSGLEPAARRVAEMMALALQASLLVRHSSSAVADAFCATRLEGDWGHAFGTLPRGLDTQAIIDRARIN